MKRIVVGETEDGLSTVVRRAAGSAAIRNPNQSEPLAIDDLCAVPAALGQSDVAVVELWLTSAATSMVPGMTVPDGAWEPEVATGESRCRLIFHGPHRSSSAHATESFDYGFLLAGELHVVLDTEEVALQPGDSIALPRVRRAWRAGPSGATLLIVMTGT